MITIKAVDSHKGYYDFDLLVQVQDIGSAQRKSLIIVRSYASIPVFVKDIKEVPTVKT